MMKELSFYYDVVCPFAYLASTLVESLASRTNARLVWKPVLLGGIYKETSAPQGASGSATDVMCSAKQILLAEDLARQARRYRVPLHSQLIEHSLRKTLSAMRLISASPEGSIRVRLTHALYKAYWCDNADVESVTVLQQIADSVHWEVSVGEVIGSDKVKAHLIANTREAVQRGAFGVPSFFAGNKLFYGTDRMFLVERYLGNLKAHPHRLATVPGPNPRRLTFYFDYSSPFSYLACVQVDRLRQTHPTLQVDYVPILLGALLKAVGTSVPPAIQFSENKRRYMLRDLLDCSEYLNGHFKWNSTFPINCLLPLRVTLAMECSPDIVRGMFNAIWRDDRNIGEEHVLKEVLEELGVGEEVVVLAQADHVKDQLRDNTQRALSTGLCGVPSFQVDGGPVLWGQDRLNVVEDMLCGWQDVDMGHSKL